MRRADACIAAIALAGCMKIYPDSELPDLEVQWFGEGCPDDEQATIIITEVTEAASRAELSAPCDQTSVTFEDIARERYQVRGEVLGSNGVAVVSADAEADLRNGFDERTGLFFQVPTNVRARWSFAMGASCASLAIEVVQIELAEDEVPVRSIGGPCLRGLVEGSVPPGSYTVRARGLSRGIPVASSPPSPPLLVSAEGITDTGTLVMSPCTAPCE